MSDSDESVEVLPTDGELMQMAMREMGVEPTEADAPYIPTGELEEAEAKGAPKADPEPEPEPEKSAEMEKVERAFASLTAKKQRFRAEREEFNAKVEEFTKAQAEFDEHLAVGKQDPIAALKLFGWDYDDATKFVLENGQIPQEKVRKELEESLREQLKKQEDELHAFRQQITEEKRQAKIASAQGMVSTEISQKIGEFPLTARYPAEEVRSAVFQTMVDYYQKTGGQYLSVQDTLGHIEGQLKQQVELLTGRDASEAYPQRGGTVPQPVNREGPQSLTNKMISQRGQSPKIDIDDLDDEERLELVKKVVDGEIKL